MSHSVSFAGVITPVYEDSSALSYSGKSAAYFLTGKRDSGEFFTVKVRFIGAALAYLLEHYEFAVVGKLEQPLAFEGTAWMSSGRHPVGSKKMRESVLIVSDVPTPIESFEVKDNPKNGRPALVGATLDAEFTAFVIGDVESGKKGTLQFLIEESGSSGYHTYVRYPLTARVRVAEGDTVEIRGRLSWIKGTSWLTPVIGIDAESINVQVSAGSYGFDWDEAPLPRGEFVNQRAAQPF